MDQTLSLYLIETIPLLDPESPTHALDLLTLVESILEDPDIILRRQLDRVKSQAMAAMKAEGVPYDERMAKLDELEYPKPNRDFIYSTFNAFADKHPWVGQENIRPKSIAREMFENFRSFADYVRDYELQRAEGLLLRHLHSVYKVLKQTVPDNAKTDSVREMELYFGIMIRSVDSSLIDEWEQMRDPEYERRIAAERAGIAGAAADVPASEQATSDITADSKSFTAAIRNRIFTFLRGLVIRDFESALECLEKVAPAHPSDVIGEHGDAAQPWTADRLRKTMEDYLAAHSQLLLTPEARNLRHTYVMPSDDQRTWRVQQMLVDPEGHNDWVAEFEVGLEKARETRQPVLRLCKIGPLV